MSYRILNSDQDSITVAGTVGVSGQPISVTISGQPINVNVLAQPARTKAVDGISTYDQNARFARPWSASIAFTSAANTTEALMTMTIFSQYGTAPASSSSFTVPTGFDLVIYAVVSTIQELTVAESFFVRLREGATTAGNQMLIWTLRAPASTAAAPAPTSFNPVFVVPQGQQFCFTGTNSAATATTTLHTFAGMLIART